MIYLLHSTFFVTNLIIMLCDLDPPFELKLQDGKSISDHVEKFFSSLPTVPDESCTDRTCIMDFSFKSDIGRENASKLFSYALERARCLYDTNAKRDPRNKFLENLQLFIGIAIVWKLISHIVLTYSDVDIAPYKRKHIVLLESLFSIVVGFFLLFRFDVTTYFAEHVTVGKTLAVITIIVVLMTVYLMLVDQNTRRVKIFMIASLILVLIAIVFVIARKQIRTNVRHATNRIIGTINANTRANIAQVPKWRVPTITFGDSLIVSFAAWLLMIYGFETAANLLMETKDDDACV